MLTGPPPKFYGTRDILRLRPAQLQGCSFLPFAAGADPSSWGWYSADTATVPLGIRGLQAYLPGGRSTLEASRMTGSCVMVRLWVDRGRAPRHVARRPSGARPGRSAGATPPRTPIWPHVHGAPIEPRSRVVAGS